MTDPREVALDAQLDQMIAKVYDMRSEYDLEHVEEILAQLKEEGMLIIPAAYHLCMAIVAMRFAKAANDRPA